MKLNILNVLLAAAILCFLPLSQVERSRSLQQRRTILPRFICRTGATAEANHVPLAGATVSGSPAKRDRPLC